MSLRTLTLLVQTGGWVGPDDGPCTAVSETHEPAVPSSLGLSPNYPNPFNGGTVIRFSLAEEQHVELVLLNLTGQEVCRLVAGVRPAGMHTVRWDGRDEQGRDLASGVYFCQLRTGVSVASRRLTLLR